jgi:hypothetical protein
MTNRGLFIALLNLAVSKIMTMLLDAGTDINAVDEKSIYCVSYRNLRTISLMRSNCLLSVVQISPSSIPMADSLLSACRA